MGWGGGGGGGATVHSPLCIMQASKLYQKGRIQGPQGPVSERFAINRKFS